MSNLYKTSYSVDEIEKGSNNLWICFGGNILWSFVNIHYTLVNNEDFKTWTALLFMIKKE